MDGISNGRGLERSRIEAATQRLASSDSAFVRHLEWSLANRS